jgi:ABC-type Zn uptake system ZnuABC Zn-binding protein ZnuA
MRGGRAVALVAAVALAGAVAACGPGGSASPGAGASAGPEALRVVATTTVFADLVREVGGSRVSVASLVPKGGEVHTFDPRPSDIRRVADAQLVIRNGLGLDDWLAGLVEDAGTAAPTVELGSGLPGATYITGPDGQVNPHLWMNAAYASAYAGRIADALTAVDPAGAGAYAAGLAAYQSRLAGLDAYAKERIGSIPPERRTVISFHDAFPYFAAAYGLTIDGSIVAAPGQDPSAGSVAELVAAIRDHHVSAIFAEAQFNDELARTIADETGVAIVSSLYTDSVGDAPQDTYEGLMRWNVDQVVGALAGS